MNAGRHTLGLQALASALDRLGEAIAQPASNPLLVDATIKRFEFTFELFWKTLKRLLEEEGITTTTPRDSIRKAYGVAWLNDEDVWLAMLRDRNATAHIYKAEEAAVIARRIPAYYAEMRRAWTLLYGRRQP